MVLQRHISAFNFFKFVRATNTPARAGSGWALEGEGRDLCPHISLACREPDNVVIALYLQPAGSPFL